MDREEKRELIKIKNQIDRQFTESDWIEFGYLLGVPEIVNNHDRLLRSLSNRDDDYDKNILEVLFKIIKADPKKFQEIQSFLSDKYSNLNLSEFVYAAHTEIPKKLIKFSPQVFEIPEKPQNEHLIAVMLPFKLGETFTAIKKACEHLNLNCKKADDIWENSTIIQDIFELIFTSRVVVADFTEKILMFFMK